MHGVAVAQVAVPQILLTTMLLEVVEAVGSLFPRLMLFLGVTTP